MPRKEAGFFVSVFFLTGRFHMNTLMIVKIKNGEENEYIL
ncbi:hypothetical protein BSUW23_12325 [Bacillus spizizenii str. W23]|uniref:Uncharacterized protein n=1 Tax=Bacillus spizizenii (strain ATCC 23059 / NRRL B-14472 / W23) TaxID=655816 RepID=E0U435_BACSH|nr:hypothetical protein BSUW23_12325 [Bacillus spizizenii str. W23]EFG90449.1 hypothetical protein BSU6633_19767 [Bacillus spizizenii ATCC 6633 = JCM 2499]KFK78104.1 hypothetical protein DJ97_2251 [Bacillus spizizenii]SPU06537.1 Uncharacterised protein [Bacillus spizizenii]